MNCLIDNVLIKYLKRGKPIEVIRRYMQWRYRVNIDIESIKERIRAHQGNYKIG